MAQAQQDLKNYDFEQADARLRSVLAELARLQAVLDKHLTGEDALDRSMDRLELEGMLQKVMRPAA